METSLSACGKNGKLHQKLVAWSFLKLQIFESFLPILVIFPFFRKKTIFCVLPILGIFFFHKKHYVFKNVHFLKILQNVIQVVGFRRWNHYKTSHFPLPSLFRPEYWWFRSRKSPLSGKCYFCNVNIDDGQSYLGGFVRVTKDVVRLTQKTIQRPLVIHVVFEKVAGAAAFCYDFELA